MEKNTFASTKTSRSSRFLFLCVAAIALVMFVTPNPAHSTDRLIVTDPSGVNTTFAAGDSGTVLRLNSTTLPATAPSYGLVYGSTSSITGLVLDSYGSPTGTSNAAALGAGGNFRFGRNTQSSPGAVALGDRLGFFVFSGYDGAEFLNTAGFTAKVDGTVSTGSVPTKLVFEALATGSPRLERMIISSSGNIGIGGDTGNGNGIPTPTHLLQLAGGAYSDGTTWNNASSRAYKENIKTLTMEEANQALDGLSPVKFNYKADKEDRHVGFIAEDVPDLVATKDRKGLSALDIVAVLTKVVQEQKNTIAEQTNMISELSKRLDTMQQEINRVKAMNIVGSIGESIK